MRDKNLGRINIQRFELDIKDELKKIGMDEAELEKLVAETKEKAMAETKEKAMAENKMAR